MKHVIHDTNGHAYTLGRWWMRKVNAPHYWMSRKSLLEALQNYDPQRPYNTKATYFLFFEKHKATVRRKENRLEIGCREFGLNALTIEQWAMGHL